MNSVIHGEVVLIKITPINSYIYKLHSMLVNYSKGIERIGGMIF